MVVLARGVGGYEGLVHDTCAAAPGEDSDPPAAHPRSDGDHR